MASHGKRFFIILFFLLCSSSVFSRTLRVGMFGQLQYLPQYSQGINARYYENYMQAIAGKSGCGYKLLQMDYDTALKGLQDGTVDLMCSMTYTQQRARTYLFSSSPCAIEYELLVASRDDMRFFNGDIESLQHKRVGLLAGDPLQEKILDSFTDAHALNIKRIYYLDSDLMAAGIRQGTIDLRMASAMAARPGEKIVQNFGSHPVYFMCKDPVIKKILDNAMSALQQQNSMYQINFIMQNNGIVSLDFSNISPDEKAYIRNIGKITVGISSGNYPFSYFDAETGELKGLDRLFWDEITRISGLSFKFTEKGRMSGEKPCLFISSDSDRFENGHAVYTRPYRTVPVRLVCAPGLSVSDFITPGSRFSEKYPVKIAVTGDVQCVLPYFRTMFVAYSIQTFPSPQKCLEKVASGVCDAALVQDYYLQTTYDINDYMSLRNRMPLTYDVPVSIAVSGQGIDPLISILNKTLCQIPADFFTRAEEQEGILARYKPARGLVLHQYLTTFLIFLIVILLYAVFSALYNAGKYKKMSETDNLTGLWNINCFERELEKLFVSMPRSNFMFMELNIRSFTLINKMYGSEWGDRTLVFLAKKLTDARDGRRNVYLARGDADNFYVLEPVITEEGTREKMEEFLKLVRKEGLKSGIQIVVKTGAVFIGPRYGGFDSVKNLVGKAGYARKYIRNSVVDNFAVFNGRLQKQRMLEENIESCMDKALENREFYVVYQPKVNLYTGKVESAEALVRWKSPENGDVAPDIFIPVFEKNGYVIKMDFYVYKAVFDYLQHLLDTHFPIIPVSLNVSRLHLNAEKFVDDFISLFSQYSIPPAYIEMEIVERTAGTADRVLKNMAELLHNHGFSVAMDDFGTGESSLNMLSEIPIDVIKFDQLFLERAESLPDSRIILREMIKMARMLGKTTVCEGVERESQVIFLKDIGCDMAQGYYFSKPLLSEDFKKFLMEHR